MTEADRNQPVNGSHNGKRRSKHSGRSHAVERHRPTQPGLAPAMVRMIGLNSWARTLVLRKQSVLETGTRSYRDGTTVPFKRWCRVPVARIQTLHAIEGAGTTEVGRLHRYTLPDGRMYEEYIQAIIQSMGPCFFIALKDSQTGHPVPDSLWTKEQLESCY